MKKYLIALVLILVASAAFSQDTNNYVTDSIINSAGIYSAVTKVKPDIMITDNASDSLALLYSSIALTNMEVNRTIKKIKTHAVIAGISFALEAMGALAFYDSTQPNHENLAKVGTLLCAAGGVAFIISYIPLLSEHPKMISCDERGLVVSIPLQSKKK